MGFSIKVSGAEELEAELRRINAIRFDAVEMKQLKEMLGRAQGPGGTPVDSGELRKSSGIYGHEMGYTEEYAAHVEYGHRIVRPGTKEEIGWVEGQHYLQNNVDIQRPIYRQDLIKAIKKG